MLTMRKREREITEVAKIREILDKSQVIHLGLSDDNQPYVVPMNYGYVLEEGRLTFYLHGAVEGYKYEVIEKNPNISFSIECDVKPFEGKMACQYGTVYSSVLGKGKAVIVEDVEEKIKAMTILMKTQTGKDFTFDEKLVSIVKVIRLDITEFSAKHRPLPASLEQEH